MIKLTSKVKRRTTNDKLHRTLTQARIKTPIIRLGFFSTATYATNTKTKKAKQRIKTRGIQSISVAKVARILDKGTIHNGGYIPPRPFLSNLHHRKKAEWKQYFDDVMREEYTLTHDLAKATKATFNAFAVKIKKDLKDTIRDLKSPPNAPSTIKMKRSSNPLIDTGFLRNNATYKIYR